MMEGVELARGTEEPGTQSNPCQPIMHTTRAPDTSHTEEDGDPSGRPVKHREDQVPLSSGLSGGSGRKEEECPL